MTPEEYVEAVLALVERIPPGRVMSYGAIAEYLADGRARLGAPGRARSWPGTAARCPWHRVVAANGRLVPGHEAEALAPATSARARRCADGRVDMRRAVLVPGLTA